MITEFIKRMSGLFSSFLCCCGRRADRERYPYTDDSDENESIAGSRSNGKRGGKKKKNSDDELSKESSVGVSTLHVPLL